MRSMIIVLHSGGGSGGFCGTLNLKIFCYLARVFPTRFQLYFR